MGDVKSGRFVMGSEGRAAARRQPEQPETRSRRMDHRLIGVAHGRGDQWEAYCLDYDLAVQGRSFEEVQSSLVQAIHMYLDTALSEPEPIRSRLLNRRAPFLVRLTWALRLFWSALFGHATRRERVSDTFEFLACPA
jgi:hypothetical protein